MRFMVIVKANKDSEAGILPSQQIMEEMTKFNEELVKAGVMLAGEGLQASSKGARIQFSGSKRTVIDGPFAETKELVAGFWMWRVKSKEEAIEWAKRSPFREGELEIRQVFESEDFGDALTPELKGKRSQAAYASGSPKIDLVTRALWRGCLARVSSTAKFLAQCRNGALAVRSTSGGTE